MREALKVVQSSLPGFGSSIGGTEAVTLSAKVAEWHASAYAGFRRVLEEGSDCAPDLKKIRALADAHRSGVRDFVVLGIGGSSLGAEAIVRAAAAATSSGGLVSAHETGSVPDRLK